MVGEGPDGQDGECKGQFMSNLRERWTDPITARRVPSKWKNGTRGNKGSKGNIVYKPIYPMYISE